MLLWTLCFFCLITAARSAWNDTRIGERIFTIKREALVLQSAVSLFHELQETLEAGMVPSSERWDAVKKLRAPWGPLASESLQALRAQGAAILPTLKRIRTLASEHQVSLKNARAKAAQALAQSVVCLLLVPVFGVALYALMPGVQEEPWGWALACLISFVVTLSGSLWLIQISESARWGGLPPQERGWVIGAQCAGERFLATVRAGNPSDIAWTQAIELLSREAPGLANAWGANVWQEAQATQITSKNQIGQVGKEARAVLIQAGSAIRKSIQVSLMEGRPCTERVEAALLALRQDFHAQVDRELALLATRALKPLFVCVAPALLGLLGYGILHACLQATSNGFGNGFGP